MNNFFPKSIALLTLGAAITSFSQQDGETRRPNILLIVFDDLNTKTGPYMDIDDHAPEGLFCESGGRHPGFGPVPDERFVWDGIGTSDRSKYGRTSTDCGTKSKNLRSVMPCAFYNKNIPYDFI